jgi:hypothetical protein
MTFFFRLAIVAGLSAWLTGLSMAAGPIDLKEFVKQAFQDQIDNLKSGIYCRTLSCNFELESFYATETGTKTYALSTSGWLEGTIPGLKGSAKRAMGLTGTYTRGTCIVKDLKPVYDNLTNNNGWGATKIESVFKGILVPATVVLKPEACAKVDAFILQASYNGEEPSQVVPEPSSNY